MIRPFRSARRIPSLVLPLLITVAAAFAPRNVGAWLGASQGNKQQGQQQEGRGTQTQGQPQEKPKKGGFFKGLKAVSGTCQGLSTAAAATLNLSDEKPRLEDFHLRAEFVSTDKAQPREPAIPPYCKDPKPGPAALLCKQIASMLERVQAAHTRVKIDGRTYRLLGPRLLPGIYPARFASHAKRAQQGATAGRTSPCLPPGVPPGAVVTGIDVLVADVNGVSRSIRVSIWSPPPQPSPQPTAPSGPEAH